MTDEVQEGAQPVDETEELVVPAVLEADVEVQQPSVPEAGITEDRLQELLDARFSQLEETFTRQAQSAKDRGISKNAQEIAELKAQLESVDGDWGALTQQADLQATREWQANIEARLAAATAPTKQSWVDEWDEESQKILDAAETDGITLSVEEYNSAMFNNGVAFTSKGDAYAALTRALNSKAKGEAIPVSAVSTEGGEVARQPEPEAPKEFRQQLDQAIEGGDDAAARKILDDKWEEIERMRAAEAAKEAMKAAGLTPEDLAE